MTKSTLYIRHKNSDTLTSYGVYAYHVSGKTIYVECAIEKDTNLAIKLSPEWSKATPVNVYILTYDITGGGEKLIDFAEFHKCELGNVSYDSADPCSVEFVMSYEYVTNQSTDDQEEAAA